MKLMERFKWWLKYGNYNPEQTPSQKDLQESRERRAYINDQLEAVREAEQSAQRRRLEVDGHE